MSQNSMFTNKRTQPYTIWESVPKADWLPKGGLSWTNRGTFRAANAYSAIEQAAESGYYVKAGDKVSTTIGPEIIIKLGATQ